MIEEKRLVDTVHELIADKVKDVDVTDAMSYIREQALHRTARFFSKHEQGHISYTDPRRFLDLEQFNRLSIEGFKVKLNSSQGNPVSYIVEW